MFLTRMPAPPLDRLVAFLWTQERDALPHPRERNLPSGRADIVIALRQEHLSRYADAADQVGVRLQGAVFQGPQERHFLRGTGEPSTVVGVHFRATGARAFAGLPVAELANKTVALADLWGNAAHELRERLQDIGGANERLACLEEALRRRLKRAPDAEDAALCWAVRQFDARPGVARVEPVRAAIGWPADRFIARFKALVGLTPKRYCRVRRFQAVLDRAAQGHAIEWSALALDAGYSDQSHLNREFRFYSGLTPGRYLPVAHDRCGHVAEWG